MSGSGGSDDDEPTCWGCIEGQPNQVAHMDVGGCLYDGYTTDEEDVDADADADAEVEVYWETKPFTLRRK